MNKLLRSLLQICACAAVAASLPQGAVAQPLASATFLTHTGGDDKDHDTGIYIDVYTADRRILLAHIENADNCGGCHYDDHSEHGFNIPVVARAERWQCENFIVVLRTRANGNDRWIIDHASVTLNFAGGPPLEKSRRNFELNSRGSQFASIEF